MVHIAKHEEQGRPIDAQLGYFVVNWESGRGSGCS